MSTLIERLPGARLNVPIPPARTLLAYLHSGDVLRQSLPKLLRIGSAVWLFFVVLFWIGAWPEIYEQYERWGLVKAFFAQVISLATAGLIVRLTLHRAEHLRTLPGDDFISLRALAVLLRWCGEIVLTFVVGMALSALLQPLSTFLGLLLNDLSPEMGNSVASGPTGMLLATLPFLLLIVPSAFVFFLVFYAAATAVDVLLAIEFNTRAERTGNSGAFIGG